MDILQDKVTSDEKNQIIKTFLSECIRGNGSETDIHKAARVLKKEIFGFIPKTLTPEEIPEFRESIRDMPEESKNKVDLAMANAALQRMPEIAIVNRIDNMCSQSLEPRLFEQWGIIKKELLNNRKQLKIMKTYFKRIKGEVDSTMVDSTVKLKKFQINFSGWVEVDAYCFNAAVIQSDSIRQDIHKHCIIESIIDETDGKKYDSIGVCEDTGRPIFDHDNYGTDGNVMWLEEKTEDRIILPEYIKREGVVYKTSDLDIEKTFKFSPSSKQDFDNQPKI